jgi:hypothetical protein
MILIGSTRCISELGSDTKESLSKVIQNDCFELKTLLGIISDLKRTGLTENINIVTNDECAELVCAQLREKLGIGGHRLDDMLHLCLKNMAKERLLLAGLRCPKFQMFLPDIFRQNSEKYFDKIIEDIKLPLVAKPIDATSSSGVHIIRDRAELADWCNQYRNEDNFELEEFIPTTTYNCDCIIKNGEIIYTQVAEGLNPCFDVTKGKTIAYRVLPHDSDIYQDLSQFNQRALTALFVVDGVTHTEVFRKEDGEIIFLEMSARPAGGDLRWVYQTFDGVVIELAHFLIRMSLPYHCNPAFTGVYAAHVSFPMRSGVVIEIPDLKYRSNAKTVWNITIGDRLQKAEDLASIKAGTVRLHGKNEEIEQDFKYLKHVVPYVVE